MEIRVVIIPDSGQTSVTEFKSFVEAGDFCYSKTSIDKLVNEPIEEVYPVSVEAVTIPGPGLKKGLIERIFNQ